MGVLGSIPGSGRSPGEGKGYPLQDSGLENSMDSIVHGVTNSRTRLSDFHFHTHLESHIRLCFFASTVKCNLGKSAVPIFTRISAYCILSFFLMFQSSFFYSFCLNSLSHSFKAALMATASQFSFSLECLDFLLFSWRISFFSGCGVLD